MNSRAKNLLPVLEITAILVAGVVCWAVLELRHAAQKTDQDRAALRTQMQKALQDQDDLWKQYAIRLQHSFETEYNFKTHEAYKIRDEYFNIAKYLTNTVDMLQSNLTAYAYGKPADKRAAFNQRSQDFKTWIERSRARAELESFEIKCREIKNQMAIAESVSPGAATPIGDGLGTMLNGIQQVCSNYLANADNSRDLVAKNRPDLAQLGIDAASAHAQKLFELGKQAEVNGKAIALFVGSQPPLDFGKLPPPDPVSLASMNPPPIASPLRRIFYTLIGAIAVLCLAVVLGLYRHFAVTPLRTKLREREATYQQSNQLDHFVRLTRELAHEIRNPLTAINARLYTLQKSLPHGTTEVGDAQVIQDEIGRLNRIVDEFLRLGSPAEPKLVRMSPGQAFEDAKDLLQPDLEKRSVEIRLDLQTDAAFRADPQQLKQVLINLIKNAADSIEQNGTITLRARRDTAPLKGVRSDVVVLEVEDTGAGIAPEVQAHLFVPFFSTKPQGTGLGLSIAARIIDKHQGNLDFESEVGKGTVFRIALPVHQSETFHV